MSKKEQTQDLIDMITKEKVLDAEIIKVINTRLRELNFKLDRICDFLDEHKERIEKLEEKNG